MRPAAAGDTKGGAAAAGPAYAASSASSAWHSPVPYLFGGLAAMLGLIALALLILVCSYWKVSGYLGSVTGADASAGPDDDDSGAATAPATKHPPALLEESIVVIMAGECKPTFLATAVAGRAASSNDECRGSRGGGAGSVDESVEASKSRRSARTNSRWD